MNSGHERGLAAVPTLTSAQVKQVDSLAAERFGIPVSWLMEAAGWQLARHCRERTFVACGTGNNGGDGLAVARHLHRWGLLGGVACTDVDSLTGAAREEARALQALGVEIGNELEFGNSDWVMDALLGTGLTGPPTGVVADWIEAVNGSGRRVIAVDLPSGLVADTGAVPGGCITAAVTVTLCLPKPALLTAEGARVAGDVWVVDIGMPNEVYTTAGIEPAGRLFAGADSVRLRTLADAATAPPPSTSASREE